MLKVTVAVGQQEEHPMMASGPVFVMGCVCVFMESKLDQTLNRYSTSLVVVVVTK